MSSGGDVLDALVAHLVEVDRRVEREPREDRHLRRGVAAGHVVGRVGLGVAELLRLRERGLVGQPAARHLGEDVVRRAVDDPVDPLDVRRRERLLQHADHRHDAGDRGLEAQLHAVLARARPQLLAVLGEQLLVGGDDVLAGPHRAQHVVARRLDAADQLDDQVGAGEDLVEVAARAGEHAAELRPQPGDRDDRVGALARAARRTRIPTVPWPSRPTLKRPGHPGPRRSRGGRRRAPRRRRRTRPAGGGSRCSWTPSRGRRRR